MCRTEDDRRQFLTIALSSPAWRRANSNRMDRMPPARRRRLLLPARSALMVLLVAGTGALVACQRRRGECPEDSLRAAYAVGTVSLGLIDRVAGAMPGGLPFEVQCSVAEGVTCASIDEPPVRLDGELAAELVHAVGASWIEHAKHNAAVVRCREDGGVVGCSLDRGRLPAEALCVR
jgi:hypothetical protein